MDTQTPLSGVDNNINLDSNIESSNITNMEPEVTATSSTLPAATKLPTDSATTIEERREATAQRILLQIQELNAEHRVKLDDLLLQLQGLDGFSATGDEAATGDEDVVSNSWDIMEPAQVLRLVRQDFDEIVIKLAITTVGAKDIDGIIAFLDKLPFKDLPSNTVTKMSDGQILINCTACEEQTRSEYMILTSCGHCYCAYCLSTLFTIAATNEALFPPSCCDKVLIPLAHVRPLLTHDAYDAFVHKKVELETPFSDRTYCSNSQCGKFVADGSAAAGFGAQTATCWSCWQMTCHRCKKNGSWGHECDGIVDDEADVALLEYAEKMHWQRCWNCYRVVEKQDGCHHMECLCGELFCYNCGDTIDGGGLCYCNKTWDEENEVWYDGGNTGRFFFKPVRGADAAAHETLDSEETAASTEPESPVHGQDELASQEHGDEETGSDDRSHGSDIDADSTDSAAKQLAEQLEWW